MLALLAALAICDLFVGVSNDAVNFLNAAVGSKAAPFWIIMAVASLGVLLGATFSSGMMEIAKTGVLVPERLTFEEVMFVYCAVMVTDVLLLNTFNSLGLPTSTTVSIIFELLGGTVAMACWKVWHTGAPFTDLGLYVNSGKALAMIMGILVSVVVAFFSGLIVQYVLRTLFTFRYWKTYKYFGAIFGGAALTAILYFLVMKGARGASFMEPAWIDWIEANTEPILICLFAGFVVLFEAAILLFKANIFPVVILSGTFALAFAFAGNDLVNFVGVPLAALDSFHIFSDAGAADPRVFTMEGLREATRTPTFFLAASGLVMCLTLWFSKKAHRVIRTSVNLASSARGGKEQFGSSLPARVIVRSSLRFHALVTQFVPASVLRWLDLRFNKPRPAPGAVELPFDEVRASINLVLAAALIASATSLKLPLSTTYVTFMVAMGSSLADGAWDRESAVYRISGVLTVISGWFVTAFTAATACAIVCTIFVFWREPAVLIGMLLAMFVIVKSNFFTKDEEAEGEDAKQLERGDRLSIKELLTSSVDRYLDSTITIFAGGLNAFLAEDHESLKRLKADAVSLFDETTQRRGEYYRMALEGGGTKADRDARNFYYRAFTNMKEAGHNLRSVMAMMENHLANQHRIYSGELRENLERMLDIVSSLHNHLSSLSISGETARKELPALANEEIQKINHYQLELLRLIDSEHLSLRSSELYLSLLQCTREIINRYTIVMVLQGELNDMCEPQRA